MELVQLFGVLYGIFVLVPLIYCVYTATPRGGF